jgi:hypothetical protein
MYSNTGAAEARIGALLADAQRQLQRGRPTEALAIQHAAAGEGRNLVGRYPDDPRLRQGLGSMLYNLASMLLAAGQPAAAVPELDDCHDQYAALIGAVADAELLCADVQARRGLAQVMLGRAASAIVDADAGVLGYLVATGGDLDHPRRPDLARVLSMNAAVLARHGDPDLAIASADAAVAYYTYPGDGSLDAQLSAEDSRYALSAATVSALLNLAGGRIADGLEQALVIVDSVPAGDVPEPLEWQLTRVGELLTHDRRIPYPVDMGRDIAESLIPVVRGRGLLWVPDARPVGPSDPPGAGWPGGELPPTLAAALERHGTGADDAALAAELTTSQPRHLLWTPSMRWLPRLPLAGVLRLAELASEVLPRAYADGLRLTLDAHALLATAHRPRSAITTPAPDEYVPAWRRLLTQAAAVCRAAGDDALAEDLAGT